MQSHCQSPTSQPARQSFVKELAKPTQKKWFKNFQRWKKNKKRNVQPDSLPSTSDRYSLHKQRPDMHGGQKARTQQTFGSLAGDVVN